MSTAEIEVRPTLGAVRPRLVLTALMLVIASFQLQATMLSPALGDMATRLHTNGGVIGWSSTVFLAVSAALAIFFPPLADKIGRRRVLLISVALMVAGTLIVLVTSSVLWLMIGRALQGFCGATFALGNLTLRAILDPRKYGFYIALVGAINSGVAGFDTLLGGVLVDAAGYKSIFVVILALEVLALIAVLLWVPETRVAAAERMDWPGAITLTLSLWALNMALTFGFGTQGWGNPWTLAAIIVGLLAAVCFVLVEKTSSNPLVPLAELVQRSTLGQLGSTFFALASAFSVLVFLLPMLSQDPINGFGMSGTLSALMYLTPFSLLGWALAPAIGKVAPTIGYRLVLRIGLAGSSLLIGAMLLGLHSRWLLFALALGMGATWAAASSTCLNALGVLYASPARPGVLPGLNSAAFNMGAGVGIGIMASVLASASAHQDPTGGYHKALLLGLVMSLLALGCSLILPGRENAEEKI